MESTFNKKSDSESTVAIVDYSEKVCGREQHAVRVRNAFKHFGSKAKPNPVFVNLNMTVAKGTIYGLLGASGCGKTTLLSCLVGRRKFNSGEICVLGGTPGKKGSGVPGKRIGYMPQELALYGEFTIEETMNYFGWILGMETDAILERLNFLLDFLDLPSKGRLVKSPSGGQQRRVSFAVALLHDPELLILDEPTVGVDPLLRRSIWNYLVDITQAGQKTIIITTHYIEEARQAHTIGLMRAGTILSEESPQTLLTTYRCSNLEDVFLTLSRNQNKMAELNVSTLAGPAIGNKTDALSCISQQSSVVDLNVHQSEAVDTTTGSVNGSSLGLYSSTAALTPGLGKIQFDGKSEKNNTGSWYNITSRGKMRALLQKNFLQMWRNISLIFFVFALPVVQVSLFCLAIGRDPTGLKLAIVNMEMNGTECYFESGCHSRGLSCRYLSHLNENILQEYYSDQDSAIEAVKTGQAWGSVYFAANFTDALVARMDLGRAAADEIDQSVIRVRLDMSNHQISYMLNRDIQFAYRDFSQDLYKDYGYNPKLGDLPIQFKEPIYGSSKPTFTDFVAPGVISTIMFFLSVAMTSMTLIAEKQDGLFDRSWVAGVSPGEILFSHIVNQFIVMFGQTVLLLTFMIYVFDVTCQGDMFTIIVLTLLTGLCGMCFGFTISTVCDKVQTAMPLAMGSLYPTILLCGVIWPIEGMPSIMRYISCVLPLTKTIEALRSVLTRGWGFDKPEVYVGFVVISAWIKVFLTIAFVMLKYKSG